MNTDNHLLLDIGAAVVIALIVLIVSPGAAVDAILVLVLLVICGVGALWSRRGRRGLGRGGLGPGGLGLRSRLRAASSGRGSAPRTRPASRSRSGAATRAAERSRARSSRPRQ